MRVLARGTSLRPAFGQYSNSHQEGACKGHQSSASIRPVCKRYREPICRDIETAKRGQQPKIIYAKSVTTPEKLYRSIWFRPDFVPHVRRQLFEQVLKVDRKSTENVAIFSVDFRSTKNFGRPKVYRKTGHIFGRLSVDQKCSVDRKSTENRATFSVDFRSTKWFSNPQKYHLLGAEACFGSGLTTLALYPILFGRWPLALKVTLAGRLNFSCGSPGWAWLAAGTQCNPKAGRSWI